MTNTVYTNYWVNERANVKKEHGSYNTEQEAINAIVAWWEIHDESYSNVSQERTNTGALEIIYDDPNYFYRIEERVISKPLPSKTYKLKSKGEIEALRKKHLLDQDTYVFDELAEPYRDRIMVAMANIQTARQYTYTEDGKPIVKALAKM